MDQFLQGTFGQRTAENVNFVTLVTAFVLIAGTVLYFVKKFFKEMCTLVLCVCTFVGVFILLVVLWTDVFGFAHVK